MAAADTVTAAVVADMWEEAEDMSVEAAEADTADTADTASLDMEKADMEEEVALDQVVVVEADTDPAVVVADMWLLLDMVVDVHPVVVADHPPLHLHPLQHQRPLTDN